MDGPYGIDGMTREEWVGVHIGDLLVTTDGARVCRVTQRWNGRNEIGLLVEFTNGMLRAIYHGDMPLRRLTDTEQRLIDFAHSSLQREVLEARKSRDHWRAQAKAARKALRDNGETCRRCREIVERAALAASATEGGETP